jgi:hypothetical protein
MDFDEATTDSGIGLETMTHAGNSLDAGDSVVQSDERPFRSVQTVRTNSVDTWFEKRASPLGSIDQFVQMLISSYIKWHFGGAPKQSDAYLR